MVIVTHEIQFARKAADRILFMEDGRIIEEGRPAGAGGQPAQRAHQAVPQHGDGRRPERASPGLPCRARLASGGLARVRRGRLRRRRAVRARWRARPSAAASTRSCSACRRSRARARAAAVDGLHLDPLPLLGALIGATERIGLCALLAGRYRRALSRGPRLRDARPSGGRPHRLDRGPRGRRPSSRGQFQRLDLPTGGPRPRRAWSS